MILPIVTYPNKILKTVSAPVTEFDEALHRFLDDMYDTMMLSNGIGLAAIQVANPIRALILCIPDEDGNQSRDRLIEIINPVIHNPKGTTLYQEGCLICTTCGSSKGGVEYPPGSAQPLANMMWFGIGSSMAPKGGRL